ncbi:MAG: imidazolonepropionase [Alphaproteobacteria bacterium]|jgi:imidazolonepropionase|nr:imidazolonepropionase [Alphaproteobacteria bacterium]MBT4018801.1 imidazolonepropionase [Alphaproteobacteria bacterium]MBT5161455.1 imidazolonepropionase [Alphaproteobacteria bacterium]MBT6385460.1 imidazolonepropionase [Alphaproteobacteria bacterium]
MAFLVDTIWRNARIATMSNGAKGYGIIEDGLIAAQDGRIAWVGSESQAPKFDAVHLYDLQGRWITPGLVDCHTHLIYGGNRAQEFEQRLEGATYEEIARAGGGIVSTVRATREASQENLIDQAIPRLASLMADGVTTIEIKSGYGLNVETEIKMLAAAKALGEESNIRVVTTFLGAHALPPEANGDSDAYITQVCEEQLPAVAAAGLADAVDAFCEGIGFSNAQTRRVFEAARAHGLPVKLHAEQLSDLGGAALAAEFGGLSADHLEYVDEAGLVAMLKAGTVAVILPGAYYFLRDTHVPPIDLMRKHGVPMALASDSNPGSSPMGSLLLALNMACTLFRMTPVEALAGVTCNGAAALGLQDEVGSIEVGKACDLAIWDIDHPAELSYTIGLNQLHMRVWNGVVEQKSAGLTS